MMTHPTFTDPAPSFEFLRSEQIRLQQQADKMMAETGILNILGRYSQLLPIGGSYKYNLLVYPDLDLGGTTAELSKDTQADLVAEIIKCPYVRKVNCADTVNFPVRLSGHPVGFWLGIQIPFENEDWGIDFWLLPADFVSEDPYEARLAALDDEAKDAILAIKYDLIRQKMYDRSVRSTDVYNAVLDHDVRSVADFHKLHAAS